MKHPAHYYVRYLLIKFPNITDDGIKKNLSDWAFLQPEDNYVLWTKAELPPAPTNFDPLNYADRASMRYLRDCGVYELFRDTNAAQEAWNILSDPEKRITVEQILMARLDKKVAASAVNKRTGWFLTSEGIEAFQHYFWNTRLLTFDEWGRFLYGRTSMYDRHMALLQGDSKLAFFHLRVEQNLESKNMIKRAQEIAYFALEEVNAKPGTDQAKVKAIQVLGKTIVECHEALSTSDMALKDVLKQFERFRMEYPQNTPIDIKELAPAGNYSGSGAKDKLPN